MRQNAPKPSKTPKKPSLNLKVVRTGAERKLAPSGKGSSHNNSGNLI